MRLATRFVAAAAAMLLPLSALGQVVEKRTLSLEGARQAIAAAAGEARRLGVGGVFAVVDDGGNLMALERLDGTFAAGAKVSIGKARTAALFKRPTRVFEQIIRDGRTPMIALEDFTPLQGGVPILIDGEVVGAIGVSGASSAQQDDDFAVIGANAVMNSASSASADAPATEVTAISAVEVAAAFAKGMPLIENGSFKIHASRRDKPGQAEVHTDETDIIYVLEGSATFVTGGTVTDGVTTAPHEIRGSAIEGGQSRTLIKGDVIVVPAGVPHWFKDVKGPLLYYVVKVID